MISGSARVTLDSGHKFNVAFDYSENSDGEMRSCWVQEVYLVSSSGETERTIKDFSKIEKELESAIKDIHDCERDGDDSDYGTWHGPDIGDEYNSYYDYCETEYGEAMREA